MKKLNGYLLAGVALLTFTVVSCEEFLDKDPISNYSNSTLGVDNNTDTLKYTTAEQAEALLATCYSNFRGELFQLDYFVNGDMQSDDAYAGASGTEFSQFDNFSIDATNKNVERDWKYLYKMVTDCNTVIVNVPKITDQALTDARKKEIVAEASFIRAWAYFDLVRLYGDVPLVLDVVTTITADNVAEVYPLLYPKRDSKELVYDQIITDLNTALDGVPVTAPNKGYVTKGAVNALLARVYATRQPIDYTKVNDYCDAVINGGYSLLSNYDYLWDFQHENSSEAIFEIQYDGNWNTGTGNWAVSMFLGTGWKKFNTPSNDLVAAFDAENDVIRKNSSIKFEDVTGSWTDANWPTSTYPFIYKIRDEASTSNIILMRLADFILLKAEALNELGLPGADTLVNQIRGRVNLPSVSPTTKEQMRLIIEKERRLELAFEGIRWFDLLRTGRAITVMENVRGGNGELLYAGKLQPYKLLWPIPQEQRDLNSMLTQNPGY